MSDRLREFLAAYLTWAESGAPEDLIFVRYAGICHNFRRYMGMIDSSDKEVIDGLNQIRSAFIADGLDDEYPFGGKHTYMDDGAEVAMHLNPQRLAWVRSKVEQFATADAK